MPSTTPNLGLYKKNPATDGNDNFDIVAMINDPLDVIDTKVGGQLVNATRTPVNLSYGVQIVNVERDAPFNVLNTRGRTLINLLGRLGNGESLTGWSAPNASLSLDTTNFTRGTASVKATATAAGSVAISTAAVGSFKQNSYYIILAEIKATTGSKPTSANIGGVIVTNAATDSTKFSTVYKAAQYTGAAGSFAANVTVSGAAINDTFNADGIRVYEITKAESDAINAGTYTVSQLEYMYPYVDDMKSVYSPVVTVYGENLVSAFSDWLQLNNTGSTDAITDMYALTTNVTDSVAHYRYVEFPCVAGRQYTYGATVTGAGAGFMVSSIDQYGVETVIAGASTYDVTTRTITAPTTAVKLRLVFKTGTANGAYTLSNPVVNPGTALIPFKPRKDYTAYFPNLPLASSVDGTVYDELKVTPNGLRKVSRFKTIDLDGTLSWLIVGDGVGFKYVKATITQGKTGTQTIIKHDGKILVADNGAATQADAGHLYSDGTVQLNIADIDSGWGEAWTSLAGLVTGLSRTTTNDDMISAFLNGWVYDTTNNRWYSRYNSSNTSNNVDFVANNYADPTHRPYRIQYQLVNAVEEHVEREGVLNLHEGANQIEVGYGAIVKERATPYYDSSANLYWINNKFGSSSGLLQYRTKVIRYIYRNKNVDSKWGIQKNSSAYGETLAPIVPTSFDPAATYEVTYDPLDLYSLGIPPQTINGEYTPNIRETVDKLTEELADARGEIHVLKRGSAQKAQPQIIAPVLLNAWVNFGSPFANVGFWKDDQGIVHLCGAVKSGTLATSGFYLPIGYKPLMDKPFNCISNNAIGRATVGANGAVVIADQSVGSNVWFSLEGITFRAEQ
jgi:hypothetical protein